MAKTRSPIPWFGGKARMVGKLLDLLPDHKIYAEVFGGGGSLLLAKDPSPVEVYNDLDSGLVNFFRVLRDPAKSAGLHMRVSSTPYSREEYDRCLDTWADCEDPVERAYRWFVVVRMSFSGIFGASFSFAVTASTRGMAQSTSSWIGSHDLIGRAHSRLMRVQIEHIDFRKILATYDTPETLFYIDPPYLASTRRSGGYRHELTDDDHRDLVDLLAGLTGKVLLSGYRNEIYRPLERAGWKRRDFPVCCSAAARTRATGLIGKGAAGAKQQRVESVWISPSAVIGSKRQTIKAKPTQPIHGCFPQQLCA